MCCACRSSRSLEDLVAAEPSQLTQEPSHYQRPSKQVRTCLCQAQHPVRAPAASTQRSRSSSRPRPERRPLSPHHSHSHPPNTLRSHGLRATKPLPLGNIPCMSPILPLRPHLSRPVLSKALSHQRTPYYSHLNWVSDRLASESPHLVSIRNTRQTCVILLSPGQNTPLLNCLDSIALRDLQRAANTD